MQSAMGTIQCIEDKKPALPVETRMEVVHLGVSASCNTSVLLCA